MFSVISSDFVISSGTNLKPSFTLSAVPFGLAEVVNVSLSVPVVVSMSI